MGPLKVIARLVDGRLIKGTTQNFRPDGADFIIVPLDGGSVTRPMDVRVSELKAMFIVHSFEGDPSHKDDNDVKPANANNGPQVRVVFKDGEVMAGTSMNYNPSAPGFFLIPVDAQSNNQRVFVSNTAVADVEVVRQSA